MNAPFLSLDALAEALGLPRTYLRNPRVTEHHMTEQAGTEPIAPMLMNARNAAKALSIGTRKLSELTKLEL